MQTETSTSLLALALGVLLTACEGESELNSATAVANAAAVDAMEQTYTHGLNPLDVSRSAIEEAFAHGFQPAGPAGISGVCGNSDGRTPVSSESGPEKATCLLLIRFSGSDQIIQGTGFIVTPSLVITAGHCVFDENWGGWADAIAVIPGGDGAHGRYNGDEVYTVAGWASHENADYDYAAIVVSDSQMHESVDFTFDLVAWDDPELRSTEFSIRGFPADKGRTEHISLPPLQPADVSSLRFGYLLDTTGGHSGSPVFSASSEEQVAGIHTQPGCPNSATRITEYRRDRILSEWDPG